MSNLLAKLFSYGDGLKRKAADAVSDPVGNFKQMVNYANDRAGNLNRLTALSTDEAIAQARGLPTSMENTNKLAQMIADSYTPMGLTVYHGSPHKFSAFDSSKIGTGEGAQAYGHGLYLAESEAVAKGYREKLNDSVIKRVKADMYDIAGDQKWSVKAFDENGKLIPKVSGYLDPEEIAKHYGDEVSKLVLGSKYGGDFKNLSIQDGAIYKVDLPDEHIAKMLDYDNPIAEAIHKPLSGKAMEQFGSGLTDTSGEKLYQEVVFNFKQAGHPNPTQAATDWLTKQGVPGMRYLDGVSRGTGAGTSNFVVFPGNESILKILSRNGEAIQ